MPGLFDGTPLERPVTCQNCGRALDECPCPRDGESRPVDRRGFRTRVRREKSRGKWTTVITGIHTDDRPELLKALRNTLGTGGGKREDDADGAGIVLQGDHRDRAVDLLASFGYRAKIAGG